MLRLYTELKAPCCYILCEDWRLRFDNSERMCITMADVKQNNVIRVSAKSVWPTSDKAVCIIGLRDWLSADNGGS